MCISHAPHCSQNSFIFISLTKIKGMAVVYKILAVLVVVNNMLVPTSCGSIKLHQLTRYMVDGNHDGAIWQAPVMSEMEDVTVDSGFSDFGTSGVRARFEANRLGPTVEGEFQSNFVENELESGVEANGLESRIGANEFESRVEANEFESRTEANEFESGVEGNGLESRIGANEFESGIEGNGLESRVEANRLGSRVEANRLGSRLEAKGVDSSDLRRQSHTGRVRTKADLEEDRHVRSFFLLGRAYAAPGWNFPLMEPVAGRLGTSYPETGTYQRGDKSRVQKRSSVRERTHNGKKNSKMNKIKMCNVKPWKVKPKPCKVSSLITPSTTFFKINNLLSHLTGGECERSVIGSLTSPEQHSIIDSIPVSRCDHSLSGCSFGEPFPKVHKHIVKEAKIQITNQTYSGFLIFKYKDAKNCMCTNSNTSDNPYPKIYDMYLLFEGQRKYKVNDSCYRNFVLG
ncbi:uncharacterized protein [Cherax quadricarinatus]|nr:uncharacterized protein LOC128689763 isoform X1 [Cherax quadricarinatus]